MLVTPDLVKNSSLKQACGPGFSWLSSTYPDGVELDDLVKRMLEDGHGDWVGWLAVGLPISKEERLRLADLATPEARGYMANNLSELSMEERLALVRRSTSTQIGMFLKNVKGAPADLIELLNEPWKKKIGRMISNGVLKLS